MPINPDVKIAYEAIKNKKDRYDLLYQYYKGNHPLKYSASRLRKAFEKLDTYFAMNWVAVIVDSVLDRLSLKGFDVSDNDAVDNRLDELWKLYNLQLIADDIHESCTITGEGYVIAMRADVEDETDDLPLDIYFNDARMCHMFYEFDKPNKERFAAKLWVDKEKYVCLTLYYKDHFEYYKSRTKAKSNEYLISSWAQFQPDPETPEEDNPDGYIPVFHFSIGRISKRKDLGPSEISLQDAINKLLADMLVSAEFQAFKQRVIISQSDPGDLQNSPFINWFIPAGDDKGQPTSVQELGGAMLDGFLNAIDKLATALAIISRTPKHYFFMQGGEPSGEALITMEGPLTKKVVKRQSAFNVTWQSFAKFLLFLDGIKDIKKSQIVPQWEPVQTILPSASAQTTQTETNSGIPLVTSLRKQGWTKQDIKQLIDDMNDKSIQSSEQSLRAEKLFWEAAQAAINAGVPLEVFLAQQGWTPEQLTDFGTKKLAAIKLKQEDVIPPTGQ